MKRGNEYILDSMSGESHIKFVHTDDRVDVTIERKPGVPAINASICLSAPQFSSLVETLANGYGRTAKAATHYIVAQQPQTVIAHDKKSDDVYELFCLDEKSGMYRWFCTGLLPAIKAVKARLVKEPALSDS